MTGSAIDLQSLLHGGEVGLMLRSSCEEVRLRLRSRSLQRRLCRGQRNAKLVSSLSLLCHRRRERFGMLCMPTFLGV